MAFSEFEYKRYEIIVGNFVERRRPPEEYRNEIDISFSLKNQTIEIFSVESVFNDKSQKVQIPIAKITYIKEGDKWKVYWMRGNLKWSLYETLSSLEDAISLVDRDKHGAFWG